MKKETKKTAKGSKIVSMENISRVSDINLMLSDHSRAFLKDFKTVLPPRLLSLLRHNLCGLNEGTQLFVCDNVLAYLRSGIMFKTGVEHIDARLGLLLIELMNEPNVNFPPF